jgi:hypothetical protein
VNPEMAQRSENVLDALSHLARGTSSRLLAFLFFLGTASAAVALAIMPAWWMVVFPATVAAAFGAWGMLDHHIRRSILRYSRTSRGVLRGVQKMTAAVGVLAAVAMIYGLFDKVLGTFIS